MRKPPIPPQFWKSLVDLADIGEGLYRDVYGGCWEIAFLLHKDEAIQWLLARGFVEISEAGKSRFVRPTEKGAARAAQPRDWREAEGYLPLTKVGKVGRLRA